MADNTYQPKIYRKQHPTGAEEFVVAAGGKVNLESATSEFGFLGEDYNATQMRAIARNATGSVLLTNQSTGSTVLSDLGGSSPPVLYSEYAVINLSLTSTMTNGSARLPSAQAGKLLTIRINAGGPSGASVRIYCSGHLSGIAGARVIGSQGSDLSVISIRQSVASYAKVVLFGESDGVWSILTTTGQVTEVPA